MLPHELLLPARTLSGTGTTDTMLAECRTFGTRGVLVHGRSLVRNGKLNALTSGQDPAPDVLCLCHPGGEPTLDQLEALRNAIRGHDAEWVAAVGGGSVIDIAKAAAGLLHATLPAEAYYAGAPIEPSRIPFIAAPTTAGTGSEATMVSVLTDPSKRIKKSIRHPSFMARLVFLDPRLLHGCPPAIVAAAGMDALTQAIEAFTSRKTSPLTDALAAMAIPAIGRSLPRFYRGADEDAYLLLEASYFAGMALSSARLGIVHGLAHPLGVRYHLPHGLVCALCLPAALRFNREAMGEKYAILENLLGGDPVDRVCTLLRTLNLSSVFHGRPILDIDEIIEETLASGSTQANPREVTASDVRRLLDTLFHGATTNPR